MFLQEIKKKVLTFFFFCRKSIDKVFTYWYNSEK